MHRKARQGRRHSLILFPQSPGARSARLATRRSARRAVARSGPLRGPALYPRHGSPPPSSRCMVCLIGPPRRISSVTTVTIRPRGSRRTSRLTSRCGVPRFSKVISTAGAAIRQSRRAAGWFRHACAMIGTSSGRRPAIPPSVEAWREARRRPAAPRASRRRAGPRRRRCDQRRLASGRTRPSRGSPRRRVRRTADRRAAG